MLETGERSLPFGRLVSRNEVFISQLHMMLCQKICGYPVNVTILRQQCISLVATTIMKQMPKRIRYTVNRPQDVS